MLEVYKNQELELLRLNEIVPNSWINLTSPSQQEIETVAALGIPQDFLTYPLDVDERPRIEEEDDGTILLIVRVATKHGQDSDIPYGTVPLGIILADKYIVTVCSQETTVMQNFTSGKVAKLSTTKRYRFTLRLLMAFTTRYLDCVREISQLTDNLEEKLINSLTNSALLELFKCQKSYLYISQALKQNELVFIRISRLSGFKKYEEDEDLLEDVITENKQAIDMTNINNDILVGLMDSFASLINNNMNIVMKILATVTIILEIPNTLTGFLGMNIQWPGVVENGSMMHIVILGVIILCEALAVWIFIKKDWF